MTAGRFLGGVLVLSVLAMAWAFTPDAARKALQRALRAVRGLLARAWRWLVTTPPQVPPDAVERHPAGRRRAGLSDAEVDARFRAITKAGRERARRPGSGR